MGQDWQWTVAWLLVVLGVLNVTIEPLSTLRFDSDEVLGVSQEAAPESPAAASDEPTVPDHEMRGQAALARLPITPADLGFTISFLPAVQGYHGLTHVPERHIEVFVRPNESDSHLAHVVAHELGHAVDLMRNDDADRLAWRTARQIPDSTPWWPNPAAPDFETGAGDFAECFAYAYVGLPNRSIFGSCAGTEALVAELALG